jgi:peptidoglycan/xylan/chitin deacetylase (PgdA/CDA1 family)
MIKEKLFGVAESLGLLAATRFLFRNRKQILMYHRVINNPIAPGIHPKDFEEQIVYLKTHFNIVSVETLINGTFSNGIALTFDDGHFDFYKFVWPILKKHGVPASLYITTGFVDKQCWLWPDFLRHILHKTERTEVTLDHIGTLSLEEKYNSSSWNKIASYCLTMENDKRSHYISDIAIKLGVNPETAPTDEFSAVTWDNLREMQTEGLDIGSHTVSHRILSTLSQDELHNEMATSKKRIETEVGITPSGICYPNGMAKDINDAVEESAKKCGYGYGLAAYPAKNSGNLMHLGRQAAPNNFGAFKRLICGVSRNNNVNGEYV